MLTRSCGSQGMNEPALRVREIEPATDVLPFRRWLFGLRDVAARNRIVMRIDYGQGYRVYICPAG